LWQAGDAYFRNDLLLKNLMTILLDGRGVNANLNVLTQTGNCMLNLIRLEWGSVKAVASTLIFKHHG
jgi:hypothetical protein